MKTVPSYNNTFEGKLKFFYFCNQMTIIIGVSFETSSDSLIDQIPSALGVFAEAVEGFIRVPSNQVKRNILFKVFFSNNVVLSVKICL